MTIRTKQDVYSLYTHDLMLAIDYHVFSRRKPETNGNWLVNDYMMVAEHVAKLVCPFPNTDGTFMLVHMDWGDHDSSNNHKKPICGLIHSSNREHAEDNSLPDPDSWSAHFHVGLISLDFSKSGDMPRHWKNGSHFCALGSTPGIAICRAALLAMIPGLK